MILDQLTKLAHFLLVKTTYEFAKLEELYVSEIVRLHGVAIFIVSDKDHQFTSKFWMSFQEALSTKVQLYIYIKVERFKGP